MPLNTISDQAIAGDFEQLTISSVAVTPTSSKLLVTLANGRTKSAARAFITVETAGMRLRFDGVAPTTSVGHLIAAGDYITIDGVENVSNIKMIRATGSDSTVNVTYFYGRP